MRFVAKSIISAVRLIAVPIVGNRKHNRYRCNTNQFLLYYHNIYKKNSSSRGLTNKSRGENL